MPSARSLLVIWGFVFLGVLCGCNKSLAPGDPISGKADAEVTHLAIPGGTLLAPVIAQGTSTTTTGVSAEFPAIGVEVTLFNGVSLNLTGFRVSYAQEDGTPLAVGGNAGGLSEHMEGQFNATTNAPAPVKLTLTIPVVSASARSFIAGTDGKLGTGDDYQSTVTATIVITGTDINGNDLQIPTQVTITSHPQTVTTSLFDAARRAPVELARLIEVACSSNRESTNPSCRAPGTRRWRPFAPGA